MTAVETHFRYSALPTEAEMLALANIRKVYGIRHLKLDTVGRTLCVEYDATRLNAAAVGKLVCQTGLKVLPTDSDSVAIKCRQPRVRVA
jgi:hypothetical protein